MTLDLRGFFQVSNIVFLQARLRVRLKASSLSKIRSYCVAGYEVFEYSLNDAIIHLSSCLQHKLH